MALPCAQLNRIGSDYVVLLVDDADAARKRYKKDLDLIKPDLAAYNKQKELALGLAPGTLSKAGGSSSALTQFDPKQGSSLQVSVELPHTTTWFMSIHRLLQQASSNGLRPRTSIVTPTACFTQTTSRARRLLTGWLLRLTESALSCRLAYKFTNSFRP